MPGKLLVVLVLMSVSLVANLIGESYLAAGIGGLLVVGVLSGNNSVRNLLIILGWLGAVFTGLATVLAFVSGTVSTVASSGFALATNLYFMWCLRQDDVRNWMFGKSMNLDALGIDASQIPPAFDSRDFKIQ